MRERIATVSYLAPRRAQKLIERAEARRRASAPIEAEAARGAVHLEIGRREFSMTPDEAEAWGQRLIYLAETARREG
jgi:hypothetical protein